jgi:hypothetical protein
MNTLTENVFLMTLAGTFAGGALLQMYLDFRFNKKLDKLMVTVARLVEKPIGEFEEFVESKVEAFE